MTGVGRRRKAMERDNDGETLATEDSTYYGSVRRWTLRESIEEAR